MMQKSIVYTFLFFCAILLLPATSASIDVSYYSSDFSLTAQTTEPSFCSCSPGQTSLFLSNLGSLESDFLIRSSSSNVLPAQSIVRIAPGAQQEVPVFFPAVCTLGEQRPVTFDVVSSFGATQSITLTPFVGECYQTAFALDTVEKTLSPCQPFQSTLFITNEGGSPQNYRIDMNLPGNLSAGSVLIPPRSTANITADVTLTCGQEQTQPLTFSVHAQEERETYEIDQTILLEESYNFSLQALEAPEAVCATEDFSQTFILTNEGGVQNIFYLTSSIPQGAILLSQGEEISRQETITLDPQESFVFAVEYTPSRQRSASLRFRVTQEFGNGLAEHTTPLSIDNCFDAVFSRSTQTTYACVQDQGDKNIRVVNRGTRDMNLSIRADHPFFSDSQTLLVPAQDDTSLPISYFFNETFDGRVSFQLFRGEDILDESSSRFVVDSLATCYEPSARNARMRHDQDSFTLTLQNTGTRYSEYFLDIDANLTLDFDQNLALGRSERINLPISVVDTVAVREVYELNLTFFHQESGSFFTTTATLTIMDDPFLVRAYHAFMTWLDQTPTCTVWCIAGLIVFVILGLILLARKAQFVFNKKVFALLFIALMILTVLVHYNQGGLPDLGPEPLSTDSTVFLSLYESSSRSFDLNNFFFDPDGDELSFAVIYDQEDIQASIEDDLLTLSATNVTGMTAIQLEATDVSGLQTNSPVISVEILEVPTYTTEEYFQAYCPFIAVVIAWLVGVMIYLLMVSKPRSRRPKGSYSLRIEEA